MQQTMEVNVSASAPEWPRDVFTDLGIDAAAGREGAPDRVTAHKWFNIAAARGNAEAVRLRQELAAGAVLARRDVVGGTAPARVRAEVEHWQTQLAAWSREGSN